MQGEDDIDWVEMLATGDRVDVIVPMIARMAMESDMKAQVIVQVGAVPHLVAMLTSDNADTKYNAASALKAIAFNSQDSPARCGNACAIAQAGGIPPLLALLSSSTTGGDAKTAQIAADALKCLAANLENHGIIKPALAGLVRAGTIPKQVARDITSFLDMKCTLS